MIEGLQYKGKLNDKVCAICKLIFKKGEIILSCPNCQSLFHENHLVEWLEINNKCPVCEYDFSQIISDYSIRKSKKIASKDFEIFKRSPSGYISFSRFKKLNTLFWHIFIITIGLVIGIAPFTISAIVKGIDYAIDLTYLFLLFFITGIRVVRIGVPINKNNYRYTWKTITFSPGGIIIENFYSSIREINREDIDTIHLYVTKRRAGSTVTGYSINFEIKTLKKKRLNFGTICTVNTFDLRIQAMRQLKSQIRALYNIEPKGLEKRIIIFLKDILFYIILGVVFFTILILKIKWS